MVYPRPWDVLRSGLFSNPLQLRCWVESLSQTPTWTMFGQRPKLCRFHGLSCYIQGSSSLRDQWPKWSLTTISEPVISEPVLSALTCHQMIYWYMSDAVAVRDRQEWFEQIYSYAYIQDTHVYIYNYICVCVRKNKKISTWYPHISTKAPQIWCSRSTCAALWACVCPCRYVLPLPGWPSVEWVGFSRTLVSTLGLWSCCSEGSLSDHGWLGPMDHLWCRCGMCDAFKIQAAAFAEQSFDECDGDGGTCFQEPRNSPVPHADWRIIRRKSRLLSRLTNRENWWKLDVNLYSMFD